MPRCPATDTVTVDNEPLSLQCAFHSHEPDARHEDDHLVHLPPAMGGDHRWPNHNPLPKASDAEHQRARELQSATGRPLAACLTQARAEHSASGGR